MSLDVEEQAAMDAIVNVMNQILSWGLKANETELAFHIHGLQAFVIQRMLQRSEPGQWGEWYEGQSAPQEGKPES